MLKKLTTILGVFILSLSLTTLGHAATFNLTGTIRDFNDTHPDFEDGIADDTGIVQTTLGGDGKPVYAGQVGNPTTHGQVAFDQWYRDTAGVNLSAPLTITLDNSGNADPAIFTFDDQTFFPIDNQLLGNQGRGHNFHFTYEIHSTFNYGGGETFTFIGDDDLWVFINNKLAIDLGGVHNAETGSVDLDVQAAGLGITTGNNYSLDFFFAERHTTQSHFRIDTSLALATEEPGPSPVPEPSTMLLLSSGAMGLFRLRKKIA